MLQGTFETLALTDVMTLLARSCKSGALWLEAGPVSAAVHLEDGRCVAAESAERIGPVEDRVDLLVRIVDVCFAIARQPEGAFRFATGDPPPWKADEAVDVADAVAELEHVLAEWNEIRHAIPSLECRPRVLDDLGVEELTVDRDRWALLIAIDGVRTVRDIVVRTGRPLLDVCHEVAALIEAGAVSVDELSGDPASDEPLSAVTEPMPDAARDLAPPVASRSEAATVEPEAPYGPGVDPVSANGRANATATTVGETPAEPGAEPPEPAEGRDKGAFLRLLSNLRDD